MIRKIYKLLEIPWVYRAVVWVLVPGMDRMKRPFYEKIFTTLEGKILDVGCGPAPRTPEPKGLMVGVDINEDYIRNYTGGFIDSDPETLLKPPSIHRRFGFLVSAEYLPFRDGFFDEARTTSFFHHLPDQTAVKAVQEMNRCVRRGGRIVILEDVWPIRPWARPLAWLTRKFDRGVYMRNQEQLLNLFQSACPGKWQWERFTYTYTGLECLSLIYTKVEL